MLSDQDLQSAEASSDSVFEEGASSSAPPPLPTPGIILTVEGEPPAEDAAASSAMQRSSRRSSRRASRQAGAGQHRSPSGSRMRNGHHHPSPQQRHLNLSTSGVSRSQSMRSPNRSRPQSVDPAGRFRSRISSIPSDMALPGRLDDGRRMANSNQSLPLPDEEDVLRLRNFAVTSKGVVNRGDSFRAKSRSAHSVASVGRPATPGHHPPQDDSAAGHHPQAEEAGQEVEEAPPEVPRLSRYRVLVVGPSDVGKTALISQFQTSEYMCAYDNSQDEENEKSVPVILNGSESELVFSEHQFTGDSTVNFCDQFKADAYLVVYSVTLKKSLQSAKEALRLIHRWDDVHCKALILVGNKTDLVRHRTVSPDDGRSLAIEEGSKFIETSAGINHQVDELLVGILSQIRLKQSSAADRTLSKRQSVSLESGSAGSAKLRSGKGSSCKAKGLLKRILKKACPKSKSCDNLHVL